VPQSHRLPELITGSRREGSFSETERIPLPFIAKRPNGTVFRTVALLSAGRRRPVGALAAQRVTVWRPIRAVRTRRDDGDLQISNDRAPLCARVTAGRRTGGVGAVRIRR